MNPSQAAQATQAPQEPKNQELPLWKSEQPTLAGVDPSDPSHPYPDSNSSPVKHNENGDVKCCQKCVKKCGPIGWYFSPILDKLGYSLLTVLYHFVMFPYTLAVMIITITFFSVSVGLLILVFGFILYWFTCEISVVLARFDLAMAYYFVEDNREILSRRGRSLRLSLYKELGPCCCNSSLSFCNSIWIRMKSIILRCDTYKIFLHQMIFKPIIVFATWGIGIVCVYNICSVFAPIVYICYSPTFTKHYWCPLGDVGDCNGGECKCHTGLTVDNFGESLLFGFVALLILPISLRLSTWFAKASKAVTYLFLTDYYKKNKNEETGNLLSSSSSSSSSSKPNNGPVVDISVSVDGQKPTHADTNHSLNNVCMDPQV